jgi:Cellulase (glycosyl hydrolase family 5)
MPHHKARRTYTLMLTVAAVLIVTPVILAAGRSDTSRPALQTVAATCALPSGSFAITVCGNKFENQAGQRVVLRGVNTEGTQNACANAGAGFFGDPTIVGTNFSTEIAAMKAWGINVVRVNLNEECWLGINGVPSTTSARGPNGFNAYANAIGSYVTALNAAGIYAELDLHLNAPGSELISDAGNNDFQNPLPESNSDLFWRSVGSYFASNRAVIFGVFNEPFPPNGAVSGDSPGGWNCDLNGCTVPDYSASSNYSQIPPSTYAGEGMLDMIDSIRSVDTTAPLLVGGPDFAGDLDDWLATFYPGGVSIDPSNELAASVHIYFPAGNSPCTQSTNIVTACPDTSTGALTDQGILQVAAVAPVEIDELGDVTCSASSLAPFLTSVDAANNAGASDIGYVGWAWTTTTCDPNLITSYATGKPSAMGTAEYCALYLEGLNNGSMATCAGGPVTTTTTTMATAPPTTTTPTTTPGHPSGHGYWLVGSDGGIFTYGAAQFYGSTGALQLQRPVVGISPTNNDGGYWLVGSDGGVFTFGPNFYGSVPGLGLAPAGSSSARRLNAPIVGIVPTADQKGYFMVAADGGVFSFGDATFEGSCPGIGGCAGAAVAVMPDVSGKGYWIVTSAGDVYSFGDAVYHGGPGPQSSPITAAVRTPSGGGYLILLANGTVFAYGDGAKLGGPVGEVGGSNPANAIFTTSDGAGYWVAAANGAVFNYGDAPTEGGIAGAHLNGSIIAGAGW